MTLWAFSFPGGPSITTVVFLAPAWLAIGLYWALRLVVAGASGGLGVLREQWRRWAFAPVVVVVVAALVFVSASFRIRFELSRGAMDALASDAMSDRSAAAERVGLFPVRRIDRFDGGVRFVVDDCMLDLCGLAYSASGRPPNLGGEDLYLHVEDGWFIWVESW